MDKFIKLDGIKGYAKCIEYNGKLVAPQEFEALTGMKAMKCWKKSIKHHHQPLLTYLDAGTLVDANVSLPKTISAPANLGQSDFDLSSALKDLESRLLSSLHEVITSSVGSLKRSIEGEIRSLNTNVDELTVQHLEAERPSSIPCPLGNTLNSEQGISDIEKVIIRSTVSTLLSEEKEKEKT